jgi:carbon-monoxide dehydrogenase medium subunit
MQKTQRPQTLTGLSQVLAKHGPQALIVSDVDAKFRAPPNRVLVDIAAVKNFSKVLRRGRKVTVGTGSTFGYVLSQIKGENGLLRQAISMLANPLVRNKVAVLTALDPASPYLDLATAFVALGAKVTLQSPRGTRKLNFDDFLLEAVEGLKKGEFPSHVEFQVLDEQERVGFFRINPGGGKPTVSAAVKMKLRRNLAIGPEVVVSSSTVIPIRAPQTEKALTRLLLNDNNVSSVADVAAAEMLKFAEIEEDPYEFSLIAVAVSRAIRRVNETISL